jgi:spore coat polysaccharide biosynthesis protein SpsF
MVKTLCIIQARLTSTRLPNKVLIELSDSKLTIIEHCYLRLQQAKLIDKIIFAIPDSKSNDKLAEFLTDKKIDFYRGSENNVLDRFFQAAQTYSPKTIVRATCDNPCVDFELTERLILEQGDNDYIYCFDAPLGTSVEVFKYSALEASYKNANDDISKEHVTPYIYKNEDKFAIKKISCGNSVDIKKLRLTIDTSEDLNLVNTIYSDLYKGEPIKNSDIYSYLDKNPELVKINSDIKQVTI